MGMQFMQAARMCHVRAAIYRTGQSPRKLYAKNHPVPLCDRVPLEDQLYDDWEEYDPEGDDYSVTG